MHAYRPPQTAPQATPNSGATRSLITSQEQGQPLLRIHRQQTGWSVRGGPWWHKVPSNGTINIELATLRKALKVAQEHGKLGKVPAIKMLKPAAPREGFFERAQFEAVCRALPDALWVVVRIGYLYGWRLKSEVLTLTRR
jgi:hypothetical protein